MIPGVEAVSDGEGRFQILGLPTSRGFRLFAEPSYNKLPLRDRHKAMNLGAPLNELLKQMGPITKSDDEQEIDQSEEE